MNGLIVINGFSNYSSTLNQVKRLVEEFSLLDVNVDVKKSTEISYALINDQFVVDLPPYDFVVFLDKDKYLSRALELCGFHLFNSAHSIEACDDKMTTHLELSHHGIRMPKTIGAPLCYVNNDDYSNLDNIIEQLGLPLVAKECYGSKGAQVYLVMNKEELIEAEKSLRFKPHLYQEFIQPGGVDYRLIVINNKVVATMKRMNKEDFRSNIALGGNGVKVDLPEPFIQMAEKASKVLKLDYCGVDILEQNGKPILCEVNSNAFFEGIELATGVNVAKLYAEHIVKTINK